ncbi:MAG: hypothetical protein WC715_04795 [Patescibacteria group bacterium]|jgi:hypothetical protein
MSSGATFSPEMPFQLKPKKPKENKLEVNARQENGVNIESKSFLSGMYEKAKGMYDRAFGARREENFNDPADMESAAGSKPESRLQRIGKFLTKERENAIVTKGGKIGYDTIASIAGVKGIVDWSLYGLSKLGVKTSMRGDVHKHFTENAVERTLLGVNNRAIDLRQRAKGRGGFGSLSKEEQKEITTAGKEYRDTVREVKAKIDDVNLPEAKRLELRKNLLEIMRGHKLKETSLQKGQSDEYEGALRKYTGQKVNAFRLGRDAVNSVLTCTGFFMLRGITYGAFAALDRGKSEWDKYSRSAFKKKQESGEDAGDWKSAHNEVSAEKFREVLKGTTVTAARETYNELRHGRKEGRLNPEQIKKKLEFEKAEMEKLEEAGVGQFGKAWHKIKMRSPEILARMRALGTLTRAFGIGGTSVMAYATEGASLVQPYNHLLDNLEHQGVMDTATGNIAGGVDRFMKLYDLEEWKKRGEVIGRGADIASQKMTGRTLGGNIAFLQESFRNSGIAVAAPIYPSFLTHEGLIRHNREMLDKLPEGDPRRKKIEELIKDLKESQKASARPKTTEAMKEKIEGEPEENPGKEESREAVETPRGPRVKARPEMIEIEIVYQNNELKHREFLDNLSDQEKEYLKAMKKMASLKTDDPAYAEAKADADKKEGIFDELQNKKAEEERLYMEKKSRLSEQLKETISSEWKAKGDAEAGQKGEARAEGDISVDEKARELQKQWDKAMAKEPDAKIEPAPEDKPSHPEEGSLEPHEPEAVKAEKTEPEALKEKDKIEPKAEEPKKEAAKIEEPKEGKQIKVEQSAPAEPQSEKNEEIDSAKKILMEKGALSEELANKMARGLADGNKIKIFNEIAELTNNKKGFGPEFYDNLAEKDIDKDSVSALKYILDGKNNIAGAGGSKKLRESILENIKKTGNIEASIATVYKGEGIEHSLRRQIEANPEKFGFGKTLDDFKGNRKLFTKAVRDFSGRQAHEIALKGGLTAPAGKGKLMQFSVARPDSVSIEVFSTEVKEGKLAEAKILISGRSVDDRVVSYEPKLMAEGGKVKEAEGLEIDKKYIGKSLSEAMRAENFGKAKVIDMAAEREKRAKLAEEKKLQDTKREEGMKKEGELKKAVGAENIGQPEAKETQKVPAKKEAQEIIAQEKKEDPGNRGKVRETLERVAETTAVQPPETGKKPSEVQMKVNEHAVIKHFDINPADYNKIKDITAAEFAELINQRDAGVKVKIPYNGWWYGKKEKAAHGHLRDYIMKYKAETSDMTVEQVLKTYGISQGGAGTRPERGKALRAGAEAVRGMPLTEKEGADLYKRQSERQASQEAGEIRPPKPGPGETEGKKTGAQRESIVPKSKDWGGDREDKGGIPNTGSKGKTKSLLKELVERASGIEKTETPALNLSPQKLHMLDEIVSGRAKENEKVMNIKKAIEAGSLTGKDFAEFCVSKFSEENANNKEILRNNVKMYLDMLCDPAIAEKTTKKSRSEAIRYIKNVILAVQESK